MKKALKSVGVLIAVVVVAAIVWLAAAPPELIRVGSGYSAKIVCSNVFIAGRDPEEVLAVDVQAPGHWLLGLMRVSVDRDDRTVEAGLFGLFGGTVAHYKPGVGCATVPDGELETARRRPAPDTAPAEQAEADALWPQGNAVEPMEDTELNAVLNDAGLLGEGMRAVVVVKNGQIVAERYADGFDADTPLLGWSMTKTVTSALVGRLVRQGELSLEQDRLFSGWAGDGRAEIEIADMLGMASDLTWNEGYGSVSDVTRMLYLEPDMAAFARSNPLDETNDGGIGEVFEYSSGTTVMLSRIWQDTFSDRKTAATFPHRALFAPLGMDSAVLETDARGTYVGSSYLYATARDWARFGQFLLQRGVWEGRSILAVGYVDWMTDAHPASGGIYGRGHVWLRPPNAHRSEADPDLPDDAFFLSGHDGQSVSIIPSRDLVVVRLGLTPSDLDYKVHHLLEAVSRALSR